MKISVETMNLLKHAATINTGIIIDPGNMIYSMHESRTVRMQATVTETFPQEFALINLNQFLNTVNLVDDPELTFKGDHVEIVSPNGTQRLKYYFSDPEVIQQSNKQLKADVSYELQFSITKEQLNGLNKAAATIGADDVCVFNRGADIYISALDKRRQNGNNYEIELMSNSELENKSFKVYFRKTNLKLTANDFNVSISSKGISTWVAQNPNVPELLFHIAVERDSLFEESGE